MKACIKISNLFISFFLLQVLYSSSRGCRKLPRSTGAMCYQKGIIFNKRPQKEIKGHLPP